MQEDTYQCNNNQLTSVPENIPAHLKYIFLTSNNLTKISEEHFKTLSNLEYVDLEHNQIAYVSPGAFVECADTLEILDLGYNKLNSFIYIP